ncbi:MAG: acyl-CoA carboxylase subunit beta [Actinomycetota bacterium]|nr:acyl-CoA carboxylase subunit beta [Actinomycetota bacterium]
MVDVESRPWPAAPAGNGRGRGHDAAGPRLRAERIRSARAQAYATLDPKATDRQHARGKLTARERLELLLDQGSFVELGLFARHRSTEFGLAEQRPYTDGVVTGWGTVEGRPVVVYAHDFRIFGGSLGEVFAAKIHNVMDMAESIGAPIVALNDGAGARIQEGISALAGYGGIFRRNVRLSGVVPQISAVLGPCAGGAAYSPALTDFVLMTRATASLFVTGPDVVAAVTGEKVTQEELGGAEVHASLSGVAGSIYDDEAECLGDIRYLLSLLPSNNLEDPPYVAPSDSCDRGCDELTTVLPDSPTQAYDMGDVVAAIVDDGELFEVFPHWAPNILCGLARLDGHVTGIVANQPMVLAGVLDIAASQKAARFVRTCDAFNIPLLTLVDVPGFLPGTGQEHGGIIRHGAKLLYAYCEASVPRVQLIVRKAYGGAYLVMDAKVIGSDISYAFPTNEIAVMGAEGAVNVIFRKEISACADPEARRRELMSEYTDRLMDPLVGAERGLVDDVIDPRDTRRILVKSFRLLRTKREELMKRKHGSIPT